jgi:crotonobetainyl-CoA:carnitine CoA-transferase CaiB-like acyl-CoA transferase
MGMQTTTACNDLPPTCRSFTARDGIDLVIIANTERVWHELCAVLGLAKLVDDPRFVTSQDRYQPRAELSRAT